MIEATPIFLDLKALRRLVKQAQFYADKGDRIAFITPLITICTEALQAYVIAYDFPEERPEHAKRLRALCTVISIDVDEIFELNILKGNSEANSRKVNGMKIEMVRLLGQIDKGVDKYVRSVLKGKTPGDSSGAV